MIRPMAEGKRSDLARRCGAGVNSCRIAKRNLRIPSYPQTVKQLRPLLWARSSSRPTRRGLNPGSVSHEMSHDLPAWLRAGLLSVGG